MNELLHKHGCSTIFSIPEGLEELMSDITREVLRYQPEKTIDFIANYLNALLITRDHGLIAIKMLDYLCDCRPTMADHLLGIGLERAQADELAAMIKTEVEKDPYEEGTEKIKEIEILKKILRRYPLNEEMSVKVCQVVRNAYRDYWYKHNPMTEALTMGPEEKKEFEESLRQATTQLYRATEKIQAAYRGWLVRKDVQKYKKMKPNRKEDLTGPPLDIASSREMFLGPVIQIKVKKDDVGAMFDEEAGENLGLKYDPKKTITYEADDFLKERVPAQSAKVSVMDMILSKPSTPRDVSERSEKARSSPIPMHGEQCQKQPRISFSEAPPVMITSVDWEAQEVPEMPGLCAQIDDSIDLPGSFEIPEELAEGNNSNIQSARTVEDDENLDQ